MLKSKSEVWKKDFPLSKLGKVKCENYSYLSFIHMISYAINICLNNQSNVFVGFWNVDLKKVQVQGIWFGRLFYPLYFSPDSSDSTDFFYWLNRGSTDYRQRKTWISRNLKLFEFDQFDFTYLPRSRPRSSTIAYTSLCISSSGWLLL